jgi:hypothetical protein
MTGTTIDESLKLLAKAVVELSEGKTDGPGMSHCRSAVALAALDGDPRTAGLPSPPSQVAPSTMEPLTNEMLDGMAPRPRAQPVISPGTNEAFDLELQVRDER